MAVGCVCCLLVGLALGFCGCLVSLLLLSFASFLGCPQGKDAGWGDFARCFHSDNPALSCVFKEELVALSKQKGSGRVERWVWYLGEHQQPHVCGHGCKCTCRPFGEGGCSGKESGVTCNYDVGELS